MNNTVRIKNDSAVARSIRPYLDRGVLVTVPPSETVEIDLRMTGWDVKKNPVAYFRMLGFAFAPKNAPKPQKPVTAPAPEPVNIAPEPIKAAPEPELVKTPEAAPALVKISAEKGDVKHFHPGNKLWHTIRNVKDWVIGKVVYSEESKEYFKVESLDGSLMACARLSEEDALKITGVKP